MIWDFPENIRLLTGVSYILTGYIRFVKMVICCFYVLHICMSFFRCHGLPEVSSQRPTKGCRKVAAIGEKNKPECLWKQRRDTCTCVSLEPAEQVVSGIPELRASISQVHA